MRAFKENVKAYVAMQLAISLMLVSCDKSEAQHPIVGKWEVTYSEYWGSPGLPPIVQEYGDSSGIWVTYSADGTYETGSEDFGITEKGYWSIGETFGEFARLNKIPFERNGQSVDGTTDGLAANSRYMFRFENSKLVVHMGLVDTLYVAHFKRK